MADTKKAVKETEKAVKDAEKTVKKEAEKTVKEAEKKVKEAEKKVETKVKETAKKVAAKAPAVKKPAAKKPAAKKAAAPKADVILQYGGKEIFYKDLVKKAVQISKKTLKKQNKDVKDVKVYVKPEENMAYYVANGGDDVGSFAI